MKIQILKCEGKTIKEIETNEPCPYYRRVTPTHWEHKMGECWLRYFDSELLEEELEKWERKHGSATKTSDF